MTLAEVATAADLARPTARRLLLTLEELGYVRVRDGGLRADAAGAAARHGVCRRAGSLGHRPPAPGGPRLAGPASPRRWPSSTAPTSSTWPGSRCRRSSPCVSRSAPASRRRRPRRARCCWPRWRPTRWRRPLAQPSRSGLPPYIGRSVEQLLEELAQVRARGWALADEELAPGVRSVAAPVRDGTGAVRAAMNVTVHAAETPLDTLLDDHLPPLLRAAGEVSADWALWQCRPHAEVARPSDRPERDDLVR